MSQILVKGGSLILLPEEVELRAKEQVQQKLETERLAKERLETFLRSQGIDPELLDSQIKTEKR